MAYQVNKFNGTLLTTVEDGTIDTTADLRFIGKNYAGYGEVQNENFLHLLENFANTTAPPKKLNGQIWYDSSNKKLKFYDGSIWRVAGGAEVATTAPSGLQVGEFWWDSSAKQLYSWSGTEYVLVGPVNSPDLAASSVTAQVVKDTSNNNHSILRFTVGGASPKVVAVVSQTAFTLNPSVIASYPEFSGYSLIKKGITLTNTNSVGVSQNDYNLWGTASDSDKLGGIDADQYLRIGQIEFPTLNFGDDGFQLGADRNLRVSIDAGTEDTIFESQFQSESSAFKFRFTTTSPTTVETDVAVVDITGIVPGDDNLFDLGTTLSRWRNFWADTATVRILNVSSGITGNTVGTHRGSVLATADSQILVNADTKQIGYAGANLVGTLTGSCTGSAGSAASALQLTGLNPSESVPGTAVATIPVRNSAGNILANQFIGISDKTDRVRINNAATDPTWDSGTTSTQYRSAKTSAAAYSIAARDAQGDLYAVLFQGTATAARYADLAEKYLADAEYEVGTVVMVGGEKEVTAGNAGKRALGVVSANPAFMMNKDLEGGVYVALKGRVPVKVSGAVKKGDELVAGENGVAVVGENKVFAIALEDNDQPGIKLVEAVVL